MLNFFKKWLPKPNPIIKIPQPVKCPKCGTETGMDYNGLKYYCVMEDIICKKCGYIIITANKVIC